MIRRANNPIKVGVQIAPEHTTYKDFANVVRQIENLGVDSIWNWDHFFPLFGDPQGNHFEGWTLLTAMATLTTRAQIGCLVTCNTYRGASWCLDYRRQKGPQPCGRRPKQVKF
jgi:alkanesulfonate monooxygenase SsuD/methylene tetrahydromethanopterin reductase-like flavin-dependent oxidoreductase (luciferase family)